MSEVVSSYDNWLDSDLVDFYEVTTPEGIAVWGGGDPSEAIHYFRQQVGSRLYVSVWAENGEEARMVGQAIDVTRLVTNAISDTMERKMQWR